MDNIYIVRGSEQAGPFTDAQIRAQLAAGELTGDSLVWWDGLPEWTPISRTPLAAPAATAAPVAAPLAPAPVAPAPAAAPIAPAPVEVAAPVPGGPGTSVLAIVSLITGVLGLPFFFCWIFGGPLDLVAIITGHLALSEIKKNPLRTGKGLAMTGLICGYLSLVLLIAFNIAAVAFGSQIKDLFSTIQSQLAAQQLNSTGTSTGTATP